MTRARGKRPASPYLEILRLPGALAFSAAGFLARMPMSMFSLGTVLLVAATTGRYGLAGLVAAAGAVGYALGAPQLARLIDRFGQQRVLRPQVAVFGAATVVFMTLAEIGAPLAAVVVTGALAGATMPSVGSMVRARWSVLLAGTGRLHTAFSLESVADEIIFVVGPALVTLLATAVYPAAGVGAAMVLCVTGTLLFAAQRRTQPQPRVPGRAGGSSPVPRPRRVRTWTAVPGLVTLVPVYWFLGAMFATIDLSTVGFTAERGHLPLAGLVLGAYALGSAVGGLWYGTRHWRAPLERRFAITLAVTVAGVATFWLQPGLTSLVRGDHRRRDEHLADLDRRLRPDRAAGPAGAADRGHDLALVGDLGGGGDRLPAGRPPDRRLRRAVGLPARGRLRARRRAGRPGRAGPAQVPRRPGRSRRRPAGPDGPGQAATDTGPAVTGQALG